MSVKIEKAQPGTGDSPERKRFAGRAPLAELSPSDETARYSIAHLAEAVVVRALEGGLTREKAQEVLAALPK